MNKHFFTLTIILTTSLFSSEVIWDGKPKILSESEFQKALKLYVDKTYPKEAKAWNKYLKEEERKKQYALNHPKDKYGRVYGIVRSPYTGRIWLDRNLGASRVCTSYDDKECYGDYFQWGRDGDGHEKSNASTTTSLSYSDTPNHSNFIIAPDRPYDWRNGQNDNLWQGVNGENNPCPARFRIPTIDELTAETTSQGVKNSDSAYNNFLKLPSAGYRGYSSGSLFGRGSWGFVWSSSVDGKNARSLYFSSSNASDDWRYRASGFSVRCIKD